jgi:hypothetical protein
MELKAFERGTKASKKYDFIIGKSGACVFQIIEPGQTFREKGSHGPLDRFFIS